MNAPIKIRQSRNARLANTRKVICPYCDRDAALVSGRSIYPHRPDLFNRYFYLCDPCGAYVGCHRPSKKYGVGTVPLGRLANAELRRFKSRAHEAFDPLWKSNGRKRNDVYRWLAERMGITRNECHIGMFDIAQCEQVIKICQSNQKTI